MSLRRPSREELPLMWVGNMDSAEGRERMNLKAKIASLLRVCTDSCCYLGNKNFGLLDLRMPGLGPYWVSF